MTGRDEGGKMPGWPDVNSEVRHGFDPSGAGGDAWTDHRPGSVGRGGAGRDVKTLGLG